MKKNKALLSLVGKGIHFIINQNGILKLYQKQIKPLFSINGSVPDENLPLSDIDLIGNHLGTYTSSNYKNTKVCTSLKCDSYNFLVHRAN